jgi:hypothetical protein
MSKRVILAVACWAVTTSIAHAQSDKLAFIIPTLYGPNGLKVDSAALLPNGQTHSAHFNSAFQAEFTQFNISIASQLAAIPLPSPASGFTYTLDPTLGVMTRSTQSFGPIFAERAETIGKKKFTMGIYGQRFSFDTIEGVGLGDVPAVFTHDDPQPGGKADVVATANSLDVTLDQTALYFTYGLLDRLDASVVVPFVHVDLAVTSNATINRLGTGSNLAVHYFADPNAPNGYGNQKTYSKSGTASGLGDIVLRLKGTVVKSPGAGIALGVDVRLPTGDEENLLGSGATGVKPFLALSFGKGKAVPHLNAAYTWNGESVLAGNILTGEKKSLPDEFSWVAGLDVGVFSRLTLAADVLGRHVIDSPRLHPKTFVGLDAAKTQLPDIGFSTDSFDIVNGAFGLKFNPGGKLLVDFNVLVKFNEAGLRDKVTPLFGLEYSF